jgi:hypothetical protein
MRARRTAFERIVAITTPCGSTLFSIFLALMPEIICHFLPNHRDIVPFPAENHRDIVLCNRRAVNAGRYHVLCDDATFT